MSLRAAACGQSRFNLYYSTTPNACGEDSFFIAENTIGIADGVGGWNYYGISSAAMSQTLMLNCKTLVGAEDAPAKLNLSDPFRVAKLMRAAYQEIVDHDQVSGGSTTCCILSFNPETMMMEAANVGDSGYIVVRNGRIVAENEFQKNDRDRPNQIGVAPKNIDISFVCDIDTIETTCFPVYEGDVVVLATDGLWDNTSKAKIASVVQECVDDLPVATMAKYIVDLALSSWEKPDDITVVVATVLCARK